MPTVDELYPARYIENPEELVVIFNSLNHHHRCQASIWYNIKTYWQLFDYARMQSDIRFCSSVTVWRETDKEDILLAEYRNKKIVMELPLRIMVKGV